MTLGRTKKGAATERKQEVVGQGKSHDSRLDKAIGRKEISFKTADGPRQIGETRKWTR